MVRIYAFEDVFASDWLPTIISRVVDELTGKGEPNSWLEHTDAVLVRAGKRHWDRLKKERAKAGEERVDEWTLPYLWEWGPHRFRQPVRREIWKRRASALGLPPPPPRKRKTPESEERFTVPTDHRQSSWGVYKDAVNMGRRIDVKFTDFHVVGEWHVLPSHLRSRVVDPALIASLVDRLGAEDIQAVFPPYLETTARGVGWRVVPDSGDVKRAPLQHAPLIERATRELAQVLPESAVFAPEESRFDIIETSLGTIKSSATTSYTFQFRRDERPFRVKVFVPLTDDAVIGIRSPLPLSQLDLPYAEHTIPVPRGAALVVHATCSTCFRRGGQMSGVEEKFLYTEVAVDEPRAAPDEVRSKEPFFAVLDG